MLNNAQIRQVVALALAEDLGKGDITTNSLIPNEKIGVASILAKEEGILAGAEIAEEVFRQVDPELEVKLLVKDGTELGAGDIIATVAGKIASILKAERTALNFLQRFSGIATETNSYVKAVEGLPVQIMDTRKTTPGLRVLEKYAVKVGGGENHRMHLGDGILIKDNHLAALRSDGLSIKEIIARARQNAPLSLRGAKRRSNLQAKQTQIELEVNTPQGALEAAEAGADVIMLDNMSLEDMRRAVKAAHGRALVEASGGITLDTVRAVAETGVDFISVGALTHSVKALDISLELEPVV
jgi:nicotinate-nucleotide pyrophosphorylase (carboxylating)